MHFHHFLLPRPGDGHRAGSHRGRRPRQAVAVSPKDHSPSGPSGDADPGPPSANPGNDPVLLRRAQVLEWCDRGQKAGYACFGLAMVVFFVGFVVQFRPWIVTTIVALLALGSIVFIPAVIFGYAAKAADKEDRGEKFGY